MIILLLRDKVIEMSSTQHRHVGLGTRGARVSCEDMWLNLCPLSLHPRGCREGKIHSNFCPSLRVDQPTAVQGVVGVGEEQGILRRLILPDRSGLDPAVLVGVLPRIPSGEQRRHVSGRATPRAQAPASSSEVTRRGEREHPRRWARNPRTASDGTRGGGRRGPAGEGTSGGGYRGV